jgi:MFS family permease
VNIFPRMARIISVPSNQEFTQAGEHVRRNFIVNTLDAMSWFFGDTFAAYQTILPVFAATLTASPVIIGLVPAIHEAGWFLPQLFLANYIERLPRRLPAVLWMGVFERLPYLMLVLAALWLPKLAENTAVLLFVLLMVWKALASGFVALPWQELIASVMPMSLRGRFFGVSRFAGNFLGLGAAAIAGVVLSRQAYPHNYAIIFAIAFGGVVLSFIFLSLTREPSLPYIQSEKKNTLRVLARSWLQILKNNVNFRRYLLSRGLAYMGNMAFAFVAVYGIQKFSLPDAYAAVFTWILFGSGTIGYAVCGTLSDRFGQKLILVASGLFWVLALLTLLLIHVVPSLYIAFFLMGLGQSAWVIGDLNIAMEFDKGPQRPTYIGLARTLTSPVLLVAPILAGGLVELFDYPFMFAFALLFSLLGLALLVLGVTDPRKLGTGKILERPPVEVNDF